MVVLDVGTYWEGIGCIRNEETRLTDGTVTNDHTFDGLHIDMFFSRLPI